jgi:hypothetical protein
MRLLLCIMFGMFSTQPYQHLKPKIAKSHWILKEISIGENKEWSTKFNTSSDSCFIVNFSGRRLFDGLGKLTISGRSNLPSRYRTQMSFTGYYTVNSKDKSLSFTWPKKRSYIPEQYRNSFHDIISAGFRMSNAQYAFSVRNDELVLLDTSGHEARRIVLVKYYGM